MPQQTLGYRTPAPARSLIAAAVIAAILGTVYALVTASMAVGMSGAGHGWISASITRIGIFIIPAAAVCIIYRRTSAGLAGAVATLVAGVVVDLMLFTATLDEGTEYVVRVWRALPGLLIAWFLMWSGWQLALVTVIALRMRAWRGGA